MCILLPSENLPFFFSDLVDASLFLVFCLPTLACYKDALDMAFYATVKLHCNDLEEVENWIGNL